MFECFVVGEKKNMVNDNEFHSSPIHESIEKYIFFTALFFFPVHVFCLNGQTKCNKALCVPVMFSVCLPRVHIPQNLSGIFRTRIIRLDLLS